MANIPELTDENFKAAVASGVVLIDFSAEWCGPCRALAPVLEQVAAEVSDQAKVYKVDIDKSQQVTAMYNVTSVPTLVLLVDGQEKDRSVGLKDAESLKTMITAAV